MSKILMALGILLAACGVATGVVGLVSPSKLAAMFITLDSATNLFVGGILSFGLGTIVGMLEKYLPAAATETLPVTIKPGLAAPTVPSVSAESIPLKPLAESLTEDFSMPRMEPQPRVGMKLPGLPGFGRKTEVAATSAAAVATSIGTAAATGFEKSEKSVAETLDALEKAKSDIRSAFGNGPTNPILAPNPNVALPPPADEVEEEEVFEPVHPTGDATELYVIEEKLIRGRSARILSDGTVEAETEEGWMRFENLEHLNEYLDG